MHRKKIEKRDTFLVIGERLLVLGVFLLPALSLTVPSGYSYASVVLLIGATIHRSSSGKEYGVSPHFPDLVKLLILFLVLYAIFWIGDAAARGEGIRGFDRPSRFLLGAFCLTVIARTRTSPICLWAGLAVGSIGTGGIAIWQKFIENAPRANGFTQTNEFGSIAMLMGLMCITGLIWACEPFKRRLKRPFLGGLFLIGSVNGITASLLSGSRGAWLALLPATLVGLWVARRLSFTKAYLLVVGILATLAASAAYISPATGVASRIAVAVHEVNDYVEGNVTDTSVGHRLEMWESALELFAEKPYLGWGEVAYRQEMKGLGAIGNVNADISRYSHAHNEWFNVLAKKGITGGLILFGLYITPFILFLRLGYQSTIPGRLNRSRFSLAAAGMVFSSGFVATGMTQVSFNHNVGVMVYVFMIAALVGISTNRHWHDDKSNGPV